jgi:hypothetical protein
MKHGDARLLVVVPDPEGGQMHDHELTAQLTSLIDEALESYRGRDLVAASEVTDLLLDLRLMLLAAAEAEPTSAG